MNNEDLHKILKKLNQMDKSDLEAALQKASAILNSKDKTWNDISKKKPLS